MPFVKTCTQDYAKCEWPEAVAGPEGQGGLQLAAWADALNDLRGFLQIPVSSAVAGSLPPPPGGQQELPFSPSAGAPPPPPPTLGQASSVGGGPDVISFSHFVPDQRLTPEKRFLSYPNLVRTAAPG